MQKHKNPFGLLAESEREKKAKDPEMGERIGRGATEAGTSIENNSKIIYKKNFFLFFYYAYMDVNLTYI